MHLSSSETRLCFGGFFGSSRNLGWRAAWGARLRTRKDTLTSTEAELTSTKDTLAATADTLASTEAELTSTKDTLATTEANLADTQAALDSTCTVLADTNLTLAATVNELTAAKAALTEKDAELAAKEPMLFLHLLSTDAATLTGTDTTALDAENYLIVTVGEQTCAPIPMPEEGSYFCLIHGINMNLFHITADGIELVNASADHNCLALGEITMTIVSRDALKQE